MQHGLVKQPAQRPRAPQLRTDRSNRPTVARQRHLGTAPGQSFSSSTRRKLAAFHRPGDAFAGDRIDKTRRIAGKQKVLLWSGSLERIREACAITGNTRILALPENRYGAKSLDDARERLARTRNFDPLPKADW